MTAELCRAGNLPLLFYSEKNRGTNKMVLFYFIKYERKSVPVSVPSPLRKGGSKRLMLYLEMVTN